MSRSERYPLDHNGIRSSVATSSGIICIKYDAEIARPRTIDAVSRTTIDIDEKSLALAAKELGTTSKIDTVNAALAFVANRRKLAAAFADPFIWGSPDLADPAVRASARR